MTYYAIITPIVSILCFIFFVALLIAYLIAKKKFTFKEVGIFALLCVGMYLIIPCRYTTLGILSMNVDCLNKALKLSINPFERKYIYDSLAYTYTSGTLNDKTTVDGNMALEYYEKYMDGNYEKYKNNGYGIFPARLYLIKGDYDKVEQLTNVKSLSAYASILKGNYKEALEYFENPENKPSLSNKLLMTDLYKLTGQNELASKLKNETKEEYAKYLKDKSNTLENNNYIPIFPRTEDCVSIEALKKWFYNMKKIYKFE